MKKVFLCLISICLVLSFASCEDKTESKEIVYEQSYDDEATEWKPSLLSKAGLDNIEEPEGKKVFSKDENGNVTFTVTPATAEMLSKMASNVFSELGNITDNRTPFSIDEALDSENHFKVEYVLGSAKVSFELTLEGNVLTGQIVYP